MFHDILMSHRSASATYTPGVAFCTGSVDSKLAYASNLASATTHSLCF